MKTLEQFIIEKLKIKTVKDKGDIAFLESICEVINSIKKEFNIPLREVRRQKITGIKPAILLDTGNMLAIGVSPAWQQYKKVKKSKF